MTIDVLWIGQKQGQQHYGEESRESDQQKAERLVVQMLRQKGWTDTELGKRKKGDRGKFAMAVAVPKRVLSLVDGCGCQTSGKVV